MLHSPSTLVGGSIIGQLANGAMMRSMALHLYHSAPQSKPDKAAKTFGVLDGRALCSPNNEAMRVGYTRACGYPSVALFKPLALSNSNKRVGGRTVGGTDRGRTVGRTVGGTDRGRTVGGTDSGTDSGGTDRTSGFLVKRLKGGSLPALVAGFDNAVDSLAFGMNEVATEHFRLFTGSGYKLKCYPRTA